MKVYLSDKEWEAPIVEAIPDIKITYKEFEKGSNVAVVYGEDFWKFTDESSDVRVILKPYTYAMVFSTINDVISKLVKIKQQLNEK